MQLARLSKYLAERQQVLVVYSAVAASIVIHTPAQFVKAWILHLPAPFDLPFLEGDHVSFAVNAIRGMIFLFSIALLFAVFFRPVAAFFSEQRSKLPFGRIFENSLAVFFVCGLLVVPVKLGLMGAGYGLMSEDPFNFHDASGQIYQRLLMPAMAYFLQFRGPILFHAFSLLATLSLIFFTLLFLEVQIARTTFLEKISIAGTSFIITQFQSPGYTEQLALLIALVVVIVPMGTVPKIAAVSLALFAHEVSIILFLAIAFLYFSREEKIWTGVVAAVYALCWLMSFGFDLGRIADVRTVGGIAGFAWLTEHPLRELSGIAVSYKLLWVVFFAALSYRSAETKRLLVFVLPGILATLFGVDTSRLMAFSFFAILFGLVYVKKYALISERNLQLLFAINLCLPSVYIGLNSGMVYFDGLYQLLYRGYLFR